MKLAETVLVDRPYLAGRAIVKYLVIVAGVIAVVPSGAACLFKTIDIETMFFEFLNFFPFRHLACVPVAYRTGSACFII